MSVPVNDEQVGGVLLEVARLLEQRMREVAPERKYGFFMTLSVPGAAGHHTLSNYQQECMADVHKLVDAIGGKIEEGAA